MDSEGNKVEPKIKGAVEELLNSAFPDPDRRVLSDDWLEKYLNIGEVNFEGYKKVGEGVGSAINEGLEKTLSGGTKTDGAKKSVDELLKKLKDVEAGWANVAKGTEKATEKTGSGVDRLGASAHAMVDLKDRAAILNSGLVSLDDSFGKLKDSGKGVEEAATGFKAIDGSAKGVLETLTPLFNAFKDNSVVMSDSLNKTDASFKELYADILNGGMKVVSWFKSGFLPLFTTQLTSVIPQAFNTAFKMAFNGVKTQWKQFAEWANENMKVTVTGKEGDKDKTNVFKMKVGAFSNGGFPEDGFFFANHTEMVGQFANGKTAVANNEQITAGIEAAVYRAMSSAMGEFNGSQNVNVEITGDASDIFNAVIRENDRFIMRTGASPIRV